MSEQPSLFAGKLPVAIEAILFDMDGVIIDSEPLHLRAAQRTCQHYGIDHTRIDWRLFMGQTIRTTYQYIAQHFTDGTIAVEDLIRTKQMFYRELLPTELRLIPGAEEFLRWAKPRYGKLALTTSAARQLQETVFAQFGLHGLFDVVITGDLMRHGKPHPEPYLKTIEALGTTAACCLVIEDAVAGITSAKAAGCRVVGLTSSFAAESLRQAGADVVIDAFASLYALL